MSAPDDRDIDDISAVERCSSCGWCPAAIVLVEGDWECYNCGHDPAGDGLRADGGQPDGEVYQERLAGHESDPEDNDYATPPEIWRPLARAVDGFDLDPASGAEPTPIAEERYTEDDDGLRQPWHGWVFLNPPWSSSGDGSAKDEWLRKVRREVDRDAVDGVVVLLPAETSSHWFHDHVLAAEAVCLVGPGRIPFIGESRNPSFAMVLAAFGDVGDDLLSALDELGAVFRADQLVDEHPQVELAEVR